MFSHMCENALLLFYLSWIICKGHLVLESNFFRFWNNHWRVNKCCFMLFTLIYSTLYYFLVAFCPSRFTHLPPLCIRLAQSMYANVFDCVSWIQDYYKSIQDYYESAIHNNVLYSLALNRFHHIGNALKDAWKYKFIYLPRWYQTRAIQRFNAIHIRSTPKWMENRRARRRRGNKSKKLCCSCVKIYNTRVKWYNVGRWIVGTIFSLHGTMKWKMKK